MFRERIISVCLVGLAELRDFFSDDRWYDTSVYHFMAWKGAEENENCFFFFFRAEIPNEIVRIAFYDFLEYFDGEFLRSKKIRMKNCTI